MEPFNDSPFMTKEEKTLVLRQWEIFLRGGFRWEDFTDRLYRHLTLHCSFIAHYDRSGFYGTYFEDPESSAQFLSQFDRDRGCVSVEYGWNLWLKGEYADINRVMCEVIEPFKEDLYGRFDRSARQRDMAEAQRLAGKHGFEANFKKG